MPLGMEVGLSPGDCVRCGDPAPPPKKGGGAPSPLFDPCLLWPNGWMDQGGTWHGGGFWSTPHCARWGPSPFPKKGQSPPIFGHVYCGQTARWMKTPLGTEVDLDTSHIVLDGSQLSAKGAQQPPPLFGPCLLWPRSPISATAELLFCFFRCGTSTVASVANLVRPLQVYHAERPLLFTTHCP